MLLVALNCIGEVSKCRVHSAHVAQLASLGELALGLSRQQHTLFMARQCVGVVTDSCVHMAQTAESIGRSLKSHQHTPVSNQSPAKKHKTMHIVPEKIWECGKLAKKKSDTSSQNLTVLVIVVLIFRFAFI